MEVLYKAGGPLTASTLPTLWFLEIDFLMTVLQYMSAAALR